MSNGENIINTYLEYVNTTNTSLNTILDIISNQDASLRNLVRNHTLNNNIENIRRYPTYVSTISVPTNTILQQNRVASIRPSQYQINIATQRLTFGNIDDPKNYICPISQEEFSHTDEIIQIKHCKHNFSIPFLLHWFESNTSCPLCRYDIRRHGYSGLEDILNNYSNNNNEDNENNEDTNNNENNENINNNNENTNNNENNEDTNNDDNENNRYEYPSLYLNREELIASISRIIRINLRERFLRNPNSTFEYRIIGRRIIDYNPP